MIFNIQRYSTHDGEGIRTMIFYKGCPLHCQWCSNPESQSAEPSLLYDHRICKRFGDCTNIEPLAITTDQNGIHINRKAIPDPEKLRDCCVSRAITVCGENKSVEELLHEIEKDLPFYNQSQGGVTLSGGEPLSQGTELIELLQELRQSKIDVSVETSLHVGWPLVERTLGLIGTYLVDLKHTNSEKFRYYTGGNAVQVLTNLEKLNNHNESIILRIPVVPDFNHTQEEMSKIIDFATTLSQVKEIHFIPYHALGIEKYTMLGMEYAFAHTRAVDPNELIEYTHYAEAKGFQTRIGG